MWRRRKRSRRRRKRKRKSPSKVYEVRFFLLSEKENDFCYQCALV